MLPGALLGPFACQGNFGGTLSMNGRANVARSLMRLPLVTIDALRADGIEVGDEIAAHLTPAQHDHINFCGTYSFDITPSSAAKATARDASPHGPTKITKTTRFGPLPRRPRVSGAAAGHGRLRCGS